ncbi:cofactor-independent phosphoglycerate mutase [Thiovibrio frasassiensis]|uniref:Cofactor-independent phosphoglycerate mutase n=1 Tax=Thiovibrio frasassiensis TaxID=2984131 RepID=A0A9X4RN39_9BACT|nr:cofactor-independent phosphoglycerate mutase [Thiovibrio frasassiensis]MDG4476843.1 cofactor-independent phosphoglycerate mutase [Thiovibrio frasassiensis]
MKYIILVGDGMGDLPIAELAGKTPLAFAKTPAMDRIAREGELCLLRTVPEGFPPGSDVANLSLLGYLPQKCYSGRAPLEAASLGVSLAPDEIAFRCNLVTLRFAEDRVYMEDYSSGHISSQEAKILIEGLEAVAGTSRLRFYPGVSYRHLLVHSGELGPLVTVPPHDYTGREVTQFWQAYNRIPHLQEALAKVLPFLADHQVNRDRQAMQRNPANAIWLWGEGKSPSMPTIREQFGIEGSLISAVDLLKGIGVYAGLEILEVPGATGYLDTNYAGKAAAAIEALQTKDLVFVHVEAPDEAAHQGSLQDKLQAIEDFDGKVVKPIFEAMLGSGYDFRLAVAMDHWTPLAIRTHSADPVPVAIYDSRAVRSGSGLPYDEHSGAQAGELLADGRQFFNRVLGR